MSVLKSGLGPLLLETARPEELPVVMGILDECAAWLHSRGIAQWASPQPPHEWDRTQAQIVLGHVTLVRLEADRSLIGTLRIDWGDAVWPDDTLVAGYVHSLAVCNHARGHQVGARLLEWAQEQVAAHGRTYLRLDCWDKNLPLCRYYEGLGFRRCGDFQRGVWSGALYVLCALSGVHAGEQSLHRRPGIHSGRKRSTALCLPPTPTKLTCAICRKSMRCSKPSRRGRCWPPSRARWF